MPKMSPLLLVEEEQIETTKGVQEVELQTVQKNLDRIIPQVARKLRIQELLNDNKIGLDEIIPKLAEVVHFGENEKNRVKCLEMALEMNGAINQKEQEERTPINIIVADGTINFAQILQPRMLKNGTEGD